MSYSITLEMFEGPLDLLLHLIRKNKLDIYDIPIAEVTEQYIAYLNKMQELDIEVASEFLVTAATLISIKAKMLLPNLHDDEEVEEEDPRKELVEKLLEYEKYKSVLNIFQEMESNRSFIHFKPVDEEFLSEIAARSNPLQDIACDELSRLFSEVLSRVPTEEEEEVRKIFKKDITVYGQMRLILNVLGDNEYIHFHDIINIEMSRNEIILTFLALLELIRKSTIGIKQAHNFGPIHIFRTSLVDERVVN